MTQHWNVESVPGRYSLMNGCDTAVIVAKHAKVDIPKMLVSLEEIGFPLAYTRGLKEIKFTRIHDGGTYLNGLIKICTAGHDEMLRCLVHEIGHHVEEQEGMADDSALHKEKRYRVKFMRTVYARKDVSEYIATGFEQFYLGTAEQKKSLRKNNRVLYRRISSAHKKYSKH